MNPDPIEDMDVRLSEPTRRPVTINQHKLWLDSLLTEADHDEIDELVAEIRGTQPEGEP
jgi:hypothetical protein